MFTPIPPATLERFTSFGDLLRFLRRRAGITQMELATAVGYSDAQISRLEQNLRLPDIPTIEARFVPALGLDREPDVVARLLDLAASVRREDAPGSGMCPYKGLNYFDEADADLFAGREGLTSRLVERILSIAAGNALNAPRFLAVVGASGSGKSSLVRAGLVPALRWRQSSADWNIIVLTPTAHPLESLALSLLPGDGSPAAAASLMDDMQRDARSLHLFARRLGELQRPTRLMLVIDQFEELFALCRSEEEKAAFIDNLLKAAWEPGGPVVAVITLRADFYAHCASFPRLRDALALHQEYIGAMSDEELRRAIEEPARRGRWELEPGLVDLLLHDVGREPGALPLLSHALLETWRRRRGRTMTLSGYAASGGVRGAIAETAEAVFTDLFTPEQQAIARRILLRLTELGSENDAGDTRRRANFDELILKPEQAEATRLVLKALADARLIITGECSAEVAHEALIREWPTLRAWIEENRESLRLHRQLTAAAKEWDARNRDAEMLYRGARLAQVGEWASSHADELNTQESEFLDASRALAEREAVERDVQRQRELEAAQKLVEAERRRAEEQTHAARQLRRRSVYLAGAFITAVVMAFVAGLFGWQARLASLTAASRELAAASLSSLETDPERSVLLAMEAISRTYTLEAEEALHQSVIASRVRRTIPAFQPGEPVSVAYSPGGRQIASASPDEVVKIWDSATGELLFTARGHSAAFSPDGQRVASVAADGNVTMWDAAAGKEILLSGKIAASAGVAFSPDGARLATVTSINIPRIWDAATGAELVRFQGHKDYVSFVAFSPAGDRLLTASDDGTARLWDAASGEELLSLSDHPGWVWAAAISPDGARIATASDERAVIWDAASGAKLHALTGHLSTVYALAFSPDGARLATASQDRRVKIWDAATGSELFTLAGHTGAVTGVAFSPDGAQVVTGSEDGTLRIWDLTPSREWLTIESPESYSQQIAFSPDGSQLVGIVNNGVDTWDTGSGAVVNTLKAAGQWVTALAASPDGRWIAAASSGSTMKLWDKAGVERSSWTAHTSRIGALAFSPDGALLASGSDDYKIKLWALPPAASASAGVPPELSLTFELPGQVKSLSFSRTGNMLAAGLNNGSVKIWDLGSGEAAAGLSGHSADVVSLDFDPEGKLLATASLDGTARIWDLSTGKELFNLTSHSGAVTAVAFAPGGARFATAGRDGVMKVWETENGKELLNFTSEGAGFYSLAFSSDGARIAVSSDNHIRIYLLEIHDLIALARTRVTRALTTDECQKYLHSISPACAAPPMLPAATPLPPASAGRICQVSNTGGLYDNYFNELLLKGVRESAELFGWEANSLQSASISDFEENMQALVGADCDLIVAPGTLLETTERAAAANPDRRFMMTDFIPDPLLPNVWTQVYATDQAAFLAGYVAASVTKTGKVGVFGGIDIPQVTGFMDGFALGVGYYNQKNNASVEVIGWDVGRHVGLFAGGFCCSSEGRLMAQQLLSAGADIILPVAGETVGWAAAATVQEHGGALFIGVDTDWTVTAPEFSAVVLTSIEKRFDVSVVQASRAIVSGAYQGGIHTGTLATGEVDISPFHSLDALVSEQVKADLEQIRTGIIAGEIKTTP